MESRRAGVIAAPAGTLAAVPDAVQAAADIRDAGDVPQQDRVHALPIGGRLFLDVVRTIACRDVAAIARTNAKRITGFKRLGYSVVGDK